MTERDLAEKRATKRLHRKRKLEARAEAQRSRMFSRRYRPIKPTLGVLRRDRFGRTVKPSVIHALKFWIWHAWQRLWGRTGVARFEQENVDKTSVSSTLPA